VTPHIDPLLLPLLRARTEPESHALITSLINDDAAPVIRAILKRKLRAHASVAHAHELEDLRSEVVVQLLARLREFIGSPHEHAIGDFRAYLAVIAYNTCHLYLRRRYPERWRLKNRLRYALTHCHGLTLWQDANGEWLCGLIEWERHGKGSTAIVHPRPFEDENGTTPALTEVSTNDLAVLVPALLVRAGAPVHLDDLLRVVADLQRVRDYTVHVRSDVEGDIERQSLADVVAPAFATEVEQRSYLKRLWDEITQLPRLQRAALLLNLREANEGVVGLLPLTGVASVSRIADAIEMPATRFAELWNKLPLDDAAIASLLGVTRQQVINLRKAARARLGRRMRSRQG
jgi:DNA-directed RNA polymerase specialized sigma24 family protein